MRLPRIYDHFRRGQIFTIDEARTVLGITGNTLRKRLCELATRGYIVQIRQGLYQLSFPAEAGGFVKSSSAFAVASKVAPYCYLGFHSALRFHAGENPIEGETVFVVSPTKFNAFQFGENNFFWCQGPDPYGLETNILADEDWEFPLLVTNFEKTLVDCIKRPAHSPALPELVRLASQGQKLPNLDKLFTSASDCQVAALFNRVGCFLDIMRDAWHIPDDLLQAFQTRMSRKVTEWPILPLEKGESPTPTLASGRESRWKIHFPPNPPPAELDNRSADC